MDKISSHKDLIVWQKSIKLVSMIYLRTKSFPKDELYGLVSQIRRAAVSIPANISEGRNRGTRKDYAHFLQMAYGSANELETLLIISKDLNYFDSKENEAENLLVEILKMLRTMLDKLKS